MLYRNLILLLCRNPRINYSFQTCDYFLQIDFTDLEYKVSVVINIPLVKNSQGFCILFKKRSLPQECDAFFTMGNIMEQGVYLNFNFVYRIIKHVAERLL